LYVTSGTRLGPRERSAGWKAVDITKAKRLREAAVQSKNIKRIGAVISPNIVCKIQRPARCFTSI
jgi:hypothetical protein